MWLCMKNPAAQARAPWNAFGEILMVRQDMLYNYNTYVTLSHETQDKSIFTILKIYI